MSIVKRVAISLAVSLIAGVVLGRNKINKALSVLDSLKFDIDRVNDLDIGLTQSTVNIDLKVTNTSNIAFALNTGTVFSIQKIDIYNKQNQLIAEAFKTISNIELDANGSVIIRNIDVDVDNFKVLGSLNTLSNKENLKIKVHVLVFGKPYII